MPPAPPVTPGSVPRCQAKRGFQRGATLSDQVKACRALGGRGGQAFTNIQRGGDNRFGHLPLGSSALPGQPLHRLRDLLTGDFALLAKAGQLPEHPQRAADRLYQVNPVNLADQAQRGDDVADGQVGRHLGGLTLDHQRMPVRAMAFGPAHQRGRGVGQLRRHPLPKLRQVTALQAALLHQGVNRIERASVQPRGTVPHGVRHLAGHLTLRDVVGHAAKVFQQNHAQRGRQGPKLAQAQLAAVLVGIEKSGEYFGIEDAVGVRHISPGNAVDARQPLQRRRSQLGQAGVITARHTLADLLQLGFNQREIVKQPLGGRRGIVATKGSQRNVVIGFAQCDEVFFDTREK